MSGLEGKEAAIEELVATPEWKDALAKGEWSTMRSMMKGEFCWTDEEVDAVLISATGSPQRFVLRFHLRYAAIFTVVMVLGLYVVSELLVVLMGTQGWLRSIWDLMWWTSGLFIIMLGASWLRHRQGS